MKALFEIDDVVELVEIIQFEGKESLPNPYLYMDEYKNAINEWIIKYSYKLEELDMIAYGLINKHEDLAIIDVHPKCIKLLK